MEKLIDPNWRANWEDQSYSPVLQSNEWKDKTFREKSKSSRKVISRNIVCLKIMKLVYNNSIYNKTFLILK